MEKNGLAAGVKIRIFEKGKAIDEVIVSSVGLKEESKVVVRIRSLDLYPGTEHDFGLVSEAGGWELLFEGPMSSSERCFSQRAPAYVFEPA